MNYKLFFAIFSIGSVPLFAAAPARPGTPPAQIRHGNVGNLPNVKKAYAEVKQNRPNVENVGRGRNLLRDFDQAAKQD